MRKESYLLFLSEDPLIVNAILINLRTGSPEYIINENLKNKLGELAILRQNVIVRKVKMGDKFEFDCEKLNLNFKPAERSYNIEVIPFRYTKKLLESLEKDGYGNLNELREFNLHEIVINDPLTKFKTQNELSM